MRMIAARVSGDVRTATALAVPLQEIMHEHDSGGYPTDSPAWFIHHQIGSTLLTRGDTATALVEFAAARQIGEARGSVDAVRSSAGRAALAYAIRGAVREAERSLAYPQMSLPLSAAYLSAAESTECAARATIAVERLAPDAGTLVSELGELEAFDVVWPFAMTARARYELCMQRPFEALEVLALASASHVVQPDSFAGDAVVALTIEAHLSSGDVTEARRALSATSMRGVLTRIADARLAVQTSDFATAGTALRALRALPALGSGLRVEVLLLDAWRELLEYGVLTLEHAQGLLQAASDGLHRRAFASVPAMVLDAVGEALVPGQRVAFDDALAGIPRRTMTVRQPLSGAELRALESLREHPTLAQAAASLHISMNTLKSQLRSAYSKLGVSNRSQALAATAHQE
jgi:DNA-binding CsgD family transcriptional regulator